ncbi:MAG TPA: tyrosine-type recombinase/integrase [Verrucomicrobiae bacterium]
MQAQRNASPQTIASYRDALRLLLAFVEQTTGRAPAQQTLQDWDAPQVLRFLDHLENQRHNQVRTRNARLAAIRSFMRYVGQRFPETLALTARVLDIPTKRWERPLLSYLSKTETQSLLKTPARTWSQRRDHLLWTLLYHTGARISEILALHRDDVQSTPSPALQLRGKGRKQRLVPLEPKVAAQLKAWLTGLPAAGDTPLLTNRHGQQLTRFGAHKQLRYRLKRLQAQHPELAKRKLSPHSLRHTAAMHLLQAHVDITTIALWLGHASPATTHHYVELDLTMKRAALEKLAKTITRVRSPKPADPLLAFLQRPLLCGVLSHQKPMKSTAPHRYST